MMYGITFCHNFSDSNKIVIRITGSVHRRLSCTKLFKKFQILPIASEYLLKWVTSITDNWKIFQTISNVCAANTCCQYPNMCKCIHDMLSCVLTCPTSPMRNICMYSADENLITCIIQLLIIFKYFQLK